MYVPPQSFVEPWPGLRIGNNIAGSSSSTAGRRAYALLSVAGTIPRLRHSRVPRSPETRLLTPFCILCSPQQRRSPSMKFFYGCTAAGPALHGPCYPHAPWRLYSSLLDLAITAASESPALSSTRAFFPTKLASIPVVLLSCSLRLPSSPDYPQSPRANFFLLQTHISPIATICQLRPLFTPHSMQPALPRTLRRAPRDVWVWYSLPVAYP